MRGFSEASSNVELLAYLLGPQSDKAEQLLRRFGTFGHCLAAEALALEAEGIGPEPRTTFHVVREAARRLALRQVIERPVLTHWSALIDYCHTAIAYEAVEQFRVLFLDRKNVLIADELMQRGTIDHAPVYPREVIKRALVLNAAALILVHNHPSGSATPSRDDIEMTRQVAGAAQLLGICLHDSLVIAASGNASLRSLGLL